MLLSSVNLTKSMPFFLRKEFAGINFKKSWAQYRNRSYIKKNLSKSTVKGIYLGSFFRLLWHRGVVVIITAKLHLSKPEVSF